MLAELLGRTGLPGITEAGGAHRIPFRGRGGASIAIEGRELAGGVVSFEVELPAQAATDSPGVVRSLLRVSFSATYARVALLPGGRRVLGAKLPAASLTPLATEGVIRSLAQLGDALIRSTGQLDGARNRHGWAEYRLWQLVEPSEAVLGSWVDLKEGETRQLLEKTLRQGRLPFAAFGGALRTELDFGESGVPPLKLTAGVEQAGISFISSSGGLKPAGERKGFLLAQFELGIGVPDQSSLDLEDRERRVRMLEFNHVSGVLKAGLNRYGDPCLLYEVPRVFPGLIENLRAEFLAVMRAAKANEGEN